MKRLLVTGLFLGTTLAASAQFYIGGSATTTASDFETAVDTFDSDELGWKAYAGVNFLKYLGVEASYRDLGNFSEGTTGGSIDLDLKVIDGAVRVILPVAFLDLFAKAGYVCIAWDGNINIGDEIDNFDEDNWELFYGVGAEVKLGDRFAIRAEWERYDVSDSLNTLSAGLVYRF